MNRSFFFNATPLKYLLLISVLLAGCTTATPVPPTPAPTMDPATLVAQAVSTIGARMTEQALANPTATPVPPTNTPQPTETPVPATPTSSTPEATPTSPPTQAPAVSAKALYTTTFPENKHEYKPNERFGLALGLQNTGSVAWDPGTKIKLVGFEGEVTVQPELEINKAIEPGAKYEFSLWAFGSETLGQHVWYFQLFNAQGVAIPGGSISFSYTSS